MGLFSKIKQAVRNTADPFHVIHKDKKGKQVAEDPDPINPLTGLRRSQDAVQDPFAGQAAGLGQLPSYQPTPVPADQRIPQGLGSDVFRSTLAPLQQQGYGLGQIDPRLLTSTVRFPGGSTAAQQTAPAAQPAPADPKIQQMLQMRYGLGRMPRMFM